MEQYAELCDKKLTEKYWKFIQDDFDKFIYYGAVS